jgi:hypothetical protein
MHLRGPFQDRIWTCLSEKSTAPPGPLTGIYLMAVKRRPHWLTEEIANFLASCPSREQLLSYHPPASVQERARELLAKAESGRITADEQWELDQFEHAELLVQLIKARVRAGKAVRS